MDLQLAGKKVLVTGGSKGIGVAIGEAFAAEGANVILVSRSADSLNAAADDIRSRHQANVTTHAADLSQESAREATMARFPDIDILVNNAGAIPGGSILDMSMAKWTEAWALKVMGYIHMTQLALQQMKPRKSGTIINIIGMAGPAPRWDYICGSTGNAGLNAFTKGIGSGAADFGVRVFGINPAATRTDRIMTLTKTRAQTTFGDENRWEELLQGLPFGRLKEPQEVAALTVMLAAPQVAYLSGTVIDMDGGGQYRR
ncbi:SDR family oxidoreductase [Hyphomicrobium sp. CS1BSMeth3]|uniref:SDR family oxidoreductase n=1 Tax=Hyphomicrobium sp. CS1BSMeth3 TaxID=1892844 RepID=UPI000931BCD1|nr:SDR family oxidoreductase [Hyphomicrobium sp. CS1BSMeth3]